MQHAANGIVYGLIALAIFLCICGGIIALQVYLSKKESRWPGLIMPLVSFGFSLITLFGMAIFTVTQHDARLIKVSDRVIHHEMLDGLSEMGYDVGNDVEAARLAEVEAHIHHRIGHMNEINHQTNDSRTRILPSAHVVFMFMYFNIPTAILLMVFAGCRGRGRQRRAVEKMCLQDLG